MITITQGDYAVLEFTATDGDGVPVNLSGATFETQIKGPNGEVEVFGDSQHSIISAVDGTFSLTLSTTDTASLGEGQDKTIITKITQSSHPVYFNGFNILTVYPNIPLQ